MTLLLPDFLKRWKGSAGNERANKDSFLRDLCEALDLPIPEPKGLGSEYCFEKDLKLTHLDGSVSTGSIDLYREGCFVLEAKQGSTKAVPGSAPLRGTRAYDQYMEKGFGQAVRYARELPRRPPFVLTCDMGYAFHIWEGYSGSYGGYGARRSIKLEELAKPEIQTFFRAIWLEPNSLDPTRRRALVTREVAVELGRLATSLEPRFPVKAVANFLMRCVFTFFAEDVGLLPDKLFEGALDRWRKEPHRFVKGLESLWDAPNDGGDWGRDQVLRFNGGLFLESLALALDPREIEMLYQAARFDWADVDPSIFGTLLESAFSPEERHRLGAHYTPRAYIERLIRPALEEPLRADWELAQAEALALLGDDPSEADRAKARAVLHAFHAQLTRVRVLDPACGSGNFLYVAYDILRRLEREILTRLEDLGETRRALQLDQVSVSPAQFLGIELKPWAAAIADLVLWIGHLQWFHREHPGSVPPEPVLQAYGNIQNRDAVLVWNGTRETGRSRWDGKTFKVHPVTGKDVPDENAQTPIVELLEPRPAEWPEAEFIVGNPPFIGNKRMRDVLGDGYSEALRKTYPDVPDSVDFVLYWWHRAAEAVRNGKTRRFGLITTNSLTQTFNRRVIAFHASPSSPLSLLKNKKRLINRDEGDKGDKNKALELLWAIPDHPWADEGAAVRIAMTVGGTEGQPWLGRVVDERSAETPEAEAEAVRVEGQSVEAIHEDLSAVADLSIAIPLKANRGLASNGFALHGRGFVVTPTNWESWGRPQVVHPLLNGKGFSDCPSGLMVIDFFGLSEQEARDRFPGPYQHALEQVKPERLQNNRTSYRDRWWIFVEARGKFRPALRGLTRYIATAYTSKHRVFQFLLSEILPDDKLIAIALDDAWFLGVLESSIHQVWATGNRGNLGVGNDSVYNKTTCFDPFPFPDAREQQKQVIRDLAERLDAHRKGAQVRGVTITQMYNLLQKLRAGEAFTAKERDLHAAAQTEILRQLHDELDAAVIEAYGWAETPSPSSPLSLLKNKKTLINRDEGDEGDKKTVTCSISDEEILTRLVALNRERAEEEKRGLIRWLRPEYQAPKSAQPAATPMLVEDERPKDYESFAPPSQEPRPWPKDLKAQLAALRDLLLASDRLWTLGEIADAFKSRGRYREGIAAQLELLADLGVVIRLDGSEGPKFHRPETVGAPSK